MPALTKPVQSTASRYTFKVAKYTHQLPGWLTYKLGDKVVVLPPGILDAIDTGDLNYLLTAFTDKTNPYYRSAQKFVLKPSYTVDGTKNGTYNVAGKFIQVGKRSQATIVRSVRLCNESELPIGLVVPGVYGMVYEVITDAGDSTYCLTTDMDVPNDSVFYRMLLTQPHRFHLDCVDGDLKQLRSLSQMFHNPNVARKGLLRYHNGELYRVCQEEALVFSK